MAQVFMHPQTEQHAVVNAGSVLGVLCAGVFYLAYKRLWQHAFMAGILLAIPAFLCCSCLLGFTLPLVSIAYSLVIQDLLAADYLDRGWVELASAGL